MKQCKKDVEITLDDGTVIEGVLVVTEFVDENFNGEGLPQSLVGEWKLKHDDDLTDEQDDDLNEKAEEIVFSEKWDFENAVEVDEDEEYEEEYEKEFSLGSDD